MGDRVDLEELDRLYAAKVADDDALTVKSAHYGEANANWRRALDDAAPALLSELRRLREVDVPQLAAAWDSENRMHKVLGGIAPWDGGPLLFEMNEIALANKLKAVRAEALEEAAKVCEEEALLYKAAGWEGRYEGALQCRNRILAIIAAVEGK